MFHDDDLLLSFFKIRKTNRLFSTSSNSLRFVLGIKSLKCNTNQKLKKVATMVTSSMAVSKPLTLVEDLQIQRSRHHTCCFDYYSRMIKTSLSSLFCLKMMFHILLLGFFSGQFS
jgi:hypothetical protein